MPFAVRTDLTVASQILPRRKGILRLRRGQTVKIIGGSGLRGGHWIFQTGCSERIHLSQLVTFYDETPVDLKGQVELYQAPLSSTVGLRSVEGAVRPSVVYVQFPSETGPFLVPFGEYDNWSLRDRYNEAIRIMNTLGASEITCETFGEVRIRRGIRAKLPFGQAEMEQVKIENSGFDFHHVGAGSAPRDPRPLRWPDEPGFAAAVSSVLENSATAVTINIRSNRSHSVDGDLGLQLKKAGFDLGGTQQKAGATSLHIRATFPSAKRGWR